MDKATDFHQLILDIDTEKEIKKISLFIQKQLSEHKKKGIIIGLSGGIDSSVAAAVCARAVGVEQIFGLILPERDTNPQSVPFAEKEAKRLGIEYTIIDITPVLSSFGTYSKRDKVIKSLFPEYDNSYKNKIMLPTDLLHNQTYNVFKLIIEDTHGNQKSTRLNKEELQGIVAATNTKQRMRMMHLYYYAEKMNYLVCGTTNRTEYIQGFFVKHGDGGVDIEPLIHLYKTQIYQLASQLQVSDEIIHRKPSPDTFSSPVSDQEFYFRMPFRTLDLLLYAWEHNLDVDDVRSVMDLSIEQINRVFQDFSSKYQSTRLNRILPPSLEMK